MIILRQRQYTDDEDIYLEDYEELDPKKLSKLTDNQKRMILEDERAKAKRNTGRIVSKYGKEGERKGRKEGKKRGTKRGAIAGGIIGAIGGAALGYKTNDKPGEVNGEQDRALIGLGIGTGVGAGLGALIGRKAGADSGAAEGKARGEAKGRKIAKERGHNDIDRTTKNARIFDDYARTHKGKGKDDWEIGFREQLKAEKKERSEAAEKKRRLELEKRRLEAEEMRARAERDKAETDRDRYWDEHFGWGQYSKDRRRRDDNDDFYFYKN